MAIIIIFKKIITNVDNDRENWNPHIADGNVKWYRHFKKINSLTSPQNVNPAIPFPKCIPKIIENLFTTCMQMFMAALFIAAKR